MCEHQGHSALCSHGKLRYNEFGRAIFDLQLPKLKTTSEDANNNEGLDWRFLSFSTTQDWDLAEVETKRNQLAGRCMSDPCPDIAFECTLPRLASETF